jgi:site-specific DNA-methyltransferase (adenine-specific)
MPQELQDIFGSKDQELSRTLDPMFKPIMVCADCLKYMSSELADASIDVVITSPPYNLGIKYGRYKDRKPRNEYLEWLDDIFSQVKRVLKTNGSFFLNMGFSMVKDPWVDMDVAHIAGKHFILQNRIAWVKSLAIDNITRGHFKPVNSKRFLNNTFEQIFHFSKTGSVELDRLSIGVPYMDKANIQRWGHTGDQDLHCRGNVWFIPYDTIQSRMKRGNHPAVFPSQLANYCIRLQGVRDGMVILDPFVGIGSTVVAAYSLGVKSIGIDSDRNYIRVAENNINELAK